SSVAAALLKKQGYDVVGITMQIWPHEKGQEGGCCSLTAVDDARRVANLLDIPYYVLNFKEIFQKKVIDNFISEYDHGRTPNPCIRCNQYVKFEALLNKVKELEVDYISTGHYAKIEKRGSRYILKKANDLNKDQSYALYPLSQDALSKTLLPLGDITKSEVRKIARELGFANADKEESQEICFIPDNNYAEFFKKVSPETVKPGPIVDVHGNIIGMHGGIQFFTIGQRRGLGLARPEPTYVVKIDQKTNTLVVGSKGDALGDDLIAGEINLVSVDKIGSPMKVQAKIRYNSDGADAMLYPLNDKVKLVFNEPQVAITPGQSAVFYQGDDLIGGGIIEGEKT
ncbi:tRNA 2-thiouridine(34) synthase MnmA, partial [Candidatus Margulisiibacteriota bacterium]